MNPPEDPGLFAKAFEFAWAGVATLVSTLVGVVWKMLHGQLATMKEHHQSMIDNHSGEITRQRDHIAKLFDKLEAFARRAEERHVELLTAMHDGLNSKADK